jgi:uncharacterized DUF497 family protein
MIKNERQGNIKVFSKRFDGKDPKQIVTENEFKTFIDRSLNQKGNINEWIRIGKINEEKKKYLYDILGLSILDISIDNGRIRHILNKKHHNMTQDDLLRIVNEMNSAATVESSEKNKRDYKIVVFNKDSDNKMNIVSSIHPKHNVISIISAWKKRGKEGAPMQKSPGANGRTDPSPASD